MAGGQQEVLWQTQTSSFLFSWSESVLCLWNFGALTFVSAADLSCSGGRSGGGRVSWRPRKSTYAALELLVALPVACSQEQLVTEEHVSE